MQSRAIENGVLLADRKWRDWVTLKAANFVNLIFKFKKKKVYIFQEYSKNTRIRVNILPFS